MMTYDHMDRTLYLSCLYCKLHKVDYLQPPHEEYPEQPTLSVLVNNPIYLSFNLLSIYLVRLVDMPSKTGRGQIRNQLSKEDKI